MFRFILKTAILLLMLLFGIIIGMQEARTGMLKMAGYDYLRFNQVLEIEENEGGELEATVFGEEISATHLEEKKRMLEEINLNHTLNEIIRAINDYLVKWIVRLIP